MLRYPPNDLSWKELWEDAYLSNLQMKTEDSRGIAERQPPPSTTLRSVHLSYLSPHSPPSSAYDPFPACQSLPCTSYSSTTACRSCHSSSRETATSTLSARTALLLSLLSVCSRSDPAVPLCVRCAAAGSVVGSSDERLSGSVALHVAVR